MLNSRCAVFVVLILGSGLGVGCAPSVNCPAGTRLKKQKRHSGEHTRISHLCLKTGSSKDVRHGPYLFRHLVDGKLRLSKRGMYKNGLRQGRWELRRGDDVVVSHFKQDFRHGLHRRKVSGDVVEQGRYRNTLREGTWMLAKSVGGGRLETERVTFLKGKRHGAATYHDTRQKLLRRGHWAAGVRHGRWTYYMPSGVIQRDEPWSKGAKHGLVRYYDGTGRLVSRTCKYIHGSREPCKDLPRPVPPRP
jgi:antitoxin component YwqK of YwqJK toxin-antitoxin module